MNLQLFVCACDSYRWIFPDFVRLADKNLPYKYKFFNEFIGNDGLGMIPTGTDVWWEKMLVCLDHLESDDVIYLQEDFLIRDVDCDAVEEAYLLHKKKNAFITKLGNNYEFTTHKLGYKVGRHQVYLQNPNDEYLMSHQPVAIYNKEFLMRSLRELQSTNASAHELDGSKWMRANGLTKVLCIGESHRPKNYSEVFHFEHAIRKGELLEDAKMYLS